MIVVLVANAKGGCGKTTVSTHLAAAFAGEGHPTALADADRQRSSLEWTRLRPGTAAPIAGLDWSKSLSAPPKGLGRLVIDAPAAMKKKDVFELVGMADVIVVPVLPSVFDQGSTVTFLGKLNELKSIRKNRKPVGVVRNRVRPRTRATARLARFLAAIEHADLGALPDRAIYNDVAAAGLSIFDLPGKRAEQLRADWAPLLGYVAGAG
ncbi:MAG TPA: ParA family protein [Geminicoccaceae bacterium]|jgi:chromosome partitioning protein|nr:ParA family protein [Geminicoccaceae bacterium]